MYPTISDYNTEIFKFGNGVLSTLGDYTFIPSRTVPVKIFSFGSKSSQGDFLKIRLYILFVIV